MKWPHTLRREGADRVEGAIGFYLAAFLSLLVSVDTSWRFFRDDLHIVDLRERVVMFAVLEVGLLACGYGMRASVIRHGRPGAPRLFAWLLCAVSGYMAWQLSGVSEGIARVTLGPVLGLVMLHLALGIEIKSRTQHVTTWTRIGSELRERMLSRLGLADDDRDALTRTRDRAADRAARLALTKRAPFRSTRLRRALRVSSVALDEERRDRMLLALAALRHAEGLVDLRQDSPWTGTNPGPREDQHAGGTGVIEPVPNSRGFQDHSAPSTNVGPVPRGDLQPPPGVHNSSTPPRGPSTKPARSPVPRRTKVAGTRTRREDHELIALIRQAEKDHGPRTKRWVMGEYQVGSTTAMELLAAARNGQGEDH